MYAFKSPLALFGPLTPDAAATLVTAAADITLIIDRFGIVRDLAISSEHLVQDLQGSEYWLGKRWADLVSPDSVHKVDALLHGKTDEAPPHWRHLNHPSRNGGYVPILYSLVPMAETGLIVAFGRDLSDISDLQQRLVDTQQSMERDYAQLRHIETRSRVLFEMTSDAVLVADAASLKLIEANPAARELFGDSWRRSLPCSLCDAFSQNSQERLQTMLARVRMAGRAEAIDITLAEPQRDVSVSGAMFRQDNASMLLIRLSPIAPPPPQPPKPTALPKELSSSVEQLTERIGHVALKELVREATDVIEKLCIEAALERTGDNRASAAELLGLSRQSLYVKLHRYGLGHLAEAPPT